MVTLREKIHSITKNHLEQNNGLIMGQCLTAVGWVDGTVPDTRNVIELPMTDVAGADFAVGAAITGRRPILVLRFQDFLVLNANAIVYFAAKRKEVFQRSIPVFVRAIAREGNGTGNSHSGKLHSTYLGFPGIRVYAPMTPLEWEDCWNDFISNDDPAICCEHRAVFGDSAEMPTIYESGARISIIAISYARKNAVKAYEELARRGIKSNLIHVYKLKPLDVPVVDTVSLVVDSGYETCSIAKDIAYKQMFETGKRSHVLGLKEKQVGCNDENLTPSSDEIVSKCLEVIGEV